MFWVVPSIFLDLDKLISIKIKLNWYTFNVSLFFSLQN